MALTYTTRGNSTDNVGGSSFNLNAASNMTANARAVLCIAADNSVTGGASNNITSVTDSLGNTWSPRQKPIFDNGAASAGVQGAIFDTNQSAGAITTSTTITVTFGTSTTAKSWALGEITSAAGTMAYFVTGANGTGATTTTPSITTGTIAVGDLLIAAVAMEAGTSQTYTGDSDTTNGTWSASQYSEVGATTATGSALGVQTKLQTTTASTQTFDPTVGTSCDLICFWGQYREITVKTLAAQGAG